MEIKLEDIEKWNSFRHKVNGTKLEDIVFTKDGSPVELAENAVRDFVFTGLNNMDFILTRFYEMGFEEYAQL